MIPIEMEISSAWIVNYNEQTNLERRLADLDLIDEAQEKAHIKMVAY